MNASHGTSTASRRRPSGEPPGDLPSTYSRPAALPPAGHQRPRHLRMRHATSGREVRAPLGYSVPVALLGPLPLLWRRNWPLAAAMGAAAVVLPLVGPILLAKHVNRWHVQHLLQRGYRAVSRYPGEVSAIEWQLGLKLPRARSRVGSGLES